MAIALYTQSFGAANANAAVTIREAVTSLPAVLLATATGGLISTSGNTVLDGSGNLSVYLDTARTWRTTLDNSVAQRTGASVAVTGSRDLTAADANMDLVCSGTMTLTIPQGLGDSFKCRVILGAASGTVTVTGAAGVTVNATVAGSVTLTTGWGDLNLRARGVELIVASVNGGGGGGGTGTVTHTSGALTSNAVVVGNGTDDVKPLASLGTARYVLISAGAGSPPIFAEPIESVAFASLGSGLYDGQVKRVTSGVGNHPFYLRWHATDSAWYPEDGRQMFNCADPSTTASNTTQTINLPTVSIPGGMLGTKMGIECELLCEINTATTTLSLTMDYGATRFINWSLATNRRLGRRFGFRNINSASVQRCFIKDVNNEYDWAGTFNGNATTMAENSANALNLTGVVTGVTAGSTTGVLIRCNYYLVRG